MEVSKVSEKILKDFKSDRFDDIRRNIGDEVTNDGVFLDLQAAMRNKIKELIGDSSSEKYGLKSRAKYELAEKNSTLEAIARNRTVDNAALSEQMKAEISARVRAQLGLAPKEGEKPVQEKVPNPKKATVKRAVAGCDSKAVMIDVSDGIVQRVNELTVEESRRTPVRGRRQTPLMNPGRTPEGHLQPLGPDYAEDRPQKYCVPEQGSTTGGRTQERDPGRTPEGQLKLLGPEDERTTQRRTLEKDARHTPDGHLEPLGPEDTRTPFGRTLERDPRDTPEGYLELLGPDYTPKRNPVPERRYNRKDRRRALGKAARETWRD